MLMATKKVNFGSLGKTKEILGKPAQSAKSEKLIYLVVTYRVCSEQNVSRKNAKKFRILQKYFSENFR